jgi:methyltransferase (TIGR00027 family)
MARTDNDTWDLASSVGATATMVAAARALASTGPDPLINDPYAGPLVRAAGIDFFTKLVEGKLKPQDLDGDSSVSVSQFANVMAARTRFFDDFFLDAVASATASGTATRAGVRQAVILASGLDARAYRLPWPAGTVVFEIDQPQVIESKSAALADLGAEPTADRRVVAIDLRLDWPAALRNAGFDPAQPTAWIAEGLLGYLPAEAQDRLLDQITALSAPGSRFAAEGVPSTSDVDEDEIRERMKENSDRWRAHGFDLDFGELIFLGDRAEVTSYLQGHGWTTTSISTNDLLVQHGLPPVDDDAAWFSEVVYVSAEK